MKLLNLIYLTVFVFVIALAIYGANSRSNLNFPQNAEETEISGREFQEDILPYAIPTFFVKTTAQDLIFPTYIAMKPQLVFLDVPKPPLA